MLKGEKYKQNIIIVFLSFQFNKNHYKIHNSLDVTNLGYQENSIFFICMFS